MTECRPPSASSRSCLVEILDEVLDKGIAILDREVLLPLLGLELFVLEARVVTAPSRGAV